ncbi:MAG: carboxypeptidase-like regulatory domain-containing protein [Candidatus Nitrospinota bacterium M3_3B_026]
MTFSSQAALGYKVADVPDGGTLKGKITFSGQAPEPQKIPIEKNPEVCGTGVREIREVTVSPDGGLQHVVVYFEKIKTGKEWPKAEKGYQLNQKTCTFKPWVQVIPDKSELEVVNQDPILHNIHTYELIGNVRVTMFNEAQPTQGYTFKKNIRMRRGTTMKVECDAHNFMHAYTKVLKNPYYAITAADGSFSIDKVPPGKYKVVVWHSTLGEVKKEVSIEPGKAVEIAHEFKK